MFKEHVQIEFPVIGVPGPGNFCLCVKNVEVQVIVCRPRVAQFYSIQPSGLMQFGCSYSVPSLSSEQRLSVDVDGHAER